MKKLSITAALLAAITMVQADIQPEKVLSENTLFVGTIRNVQKTGSDLMSTPFGKLMDDPATAPLREYIKGELTSSTLDLQTALTEAGKTIASCKDVFNGGVAFAITQPQFKLQDKQTFDIKLIPLLLAETSDKVSVEKKSEMIQTKLTVLLKEIAKGALDKDADKVKISTSTKDVDSVKLNIITVGANDSKDSVNFIFAFSDKLFAASLTANIDADKLKPIDAQQVEKEIANILNGKVEGTILADSTNFKNVKIAEDHNYLYFNFDPLTGLAKDYATLLDNDYKLPENPMEAMMSLPRPLAIFNSLGISAAKSLGANSYVIDGESYTDTMFYCPKAERRGLTAIIDCMAKGDCAPVAGVSDTVVSFGRFHYDPVKLWETVDGTSSEILGGVKLMLMAGMGNALNQNKDIDLGKDVLNNLNGDLISLSTTVNFSGDMDNSATYLIGAKDPAAVINALNNCRKTLDPDNALEEFECEGTKAYKLAFGTKVEGEGANIDLTAAICLATVDGYVVVAPGEEALKSFLTAKKDNPLAKDAAFIKNSAKVGGTEQYALSYTNIKSFLPIFKALFDVNMNAIEADNKDGADENSEDGLNAEIQKILELLPKLEDVEKYMGTQYQVINIDENGVAIKDCCPWPEGLAK